jgi:hypothetical protein
MVLSQGHDDVLAQRNFEEPPTVNNLARLLADAMERATASATGSTSATSGGTRSTPRIECPGGSSPE